MKKDKLLTVADASGRLDVTMQTIRNWYRAGHIRIVRYPSQRIRVPESEVERILAGEPMPESEA